MTRTLGVRIWLFPGAAALLLAAGTLWGATALQNGVPFNTWLKGLTYANIPIAVPDTATRLTVTVTNGNGNLDLFLKRNSPAAGSTTSQLSADADARSTGPGADETIVLTPDGTPPLRGGNWYVATLNLNSTETHFTLTATYEEKAVTVVHKLTVAPDQQQATPVSKLGLKFSLDKGSSSDKVDLYAAARSPTGVLTFFGPTGVSGDPVPVGTGTPYSGQLTLPPTYVLPGAGPEGDYRIYAALVKPGQNPLDENNWVSNLASAPLHFTHLSPVQQTMVAEMGYPEHFMKSFGDDQSGLRVDEVWFYGGKGLSETFINGAFSAEQMVQPASASPRPTPYRPEHYQYDTTPQAVIARHGQPQEVRQDQMGDRIHTFYRYRDISFGFLGDRLISVFASE